MCDQDVNVSQYRIGMCGMGDITRRHVKLPALRLQEMFFKEYKRIPWRVILDPIGSKAACYGDRKMIHFVDTRRTVAVFF